MGIPERYRSPDCPFCSEPRQSVNGSKRQTCGSEDCLARGKAAKGLQNRQWGSGNVHPNSLAAKFDTKQRAAFAKWLRQIDGEQVNYERQIRHEAGLV